MLKKLAAIISGTALSISGLVVTATPAAADGRCVITNFSPRIVNVGLSPVTKTFGISTGGCNRTGWDLQASDFLFYVYDGSPQETFNPWSNSDAGFHHVIATADNSDYDETQRTFTNGFTLKRGTHWSSVDASPEPVHKGKPVTVRGKLFVADWDNHRYIAVNNASAQIQFRATTTGAWTTVRTARTSSTGWIKTTATARRSGYWRIYYAGFSKYAAAASSADYVKAT